MSNVIPLQPRPPTANIAMNAVELRLLVTALDNAEFDLQQHAPGETNASYGVAVLRTRLQIVLAQLERDAPR
jgi:hypothetical protein